jgi:ubiquinone/menaquinone biosynthesis C-methylase UbiE
LKTSNLAAVESDNVYESKRLQEVTGPAIRPGDLALTERALSLMRLPRHAAVLDIGCGLGATVTRLRDMRLNAVGLDLSKALLRDARAAGGKIPITRADAHRLPIKEGSLSAVFMECTLSLMQNPAEVLGECRRVLQPEGVLVVTDLYWRGDVPELKAAPTAGCCLYGAVDRQTMETRAKETGFTVTLWEDHTDHLKYLAAKLVFEYGSLKAFWASFGIAGEGDWCCVKPGYCLMVARKGL